MSREIVGERGRIAAREAETGVQRAAPEIAKVRMLQPLHRRVVGGFLGVRPDHLDGIFRGGHNPRSFRRDEDLAVLRRDRADHHLPAREADVQRVRRSDRIDRRPLKRHVPRSLRFQDERLGIRLDDGPRHAVAILQGNLIGKERRAQQENASQREQRLSNCISQGRFLLK